MKKIKVTGTILIFMTAICLVLSGCSKMDSSYENYKDGREKRYSKRPDVIRIFPGFERIKIWMLLSDPNITESRIYWNNKTDSVEIPVKKDAYGTDTISFMITDLPEGTFSFSVFTLDRGGNFSIGLDTATTVYGAKYENGLLNRTMWNASLVNGKPRIYWNDPVDTTLIGTNVEFKSLDNEEKVIFVSNSESVTRINEKVLGDSVQYTSLYVPDSLAIDTFYSAVKTVILKEAIPRELDKSKFKPYPLPGDIGPKSGYEMSALWDDKFYNISDAFAALGTGIPHWYTFDLGLEVSLDHFILWQFGEYSTKYFYANANIKKCEIWGSTAPDPDGSWNGWTKLAECEIAKPSGLPLEKNTDEDIENALNGHKFIVAENSPPVRFIRIKVLETWKTYGDGHSVLQEISFYGIPK